VLPLAIVGLAVGCATSERIAMQGHREDEEAIKRVIMNMTDAFNRHEPDAPADCPLRSQTSGWTGSATQLASYPAPGVWSRDEQ